MAIRTFDIKLVGQSQLHVPSVKLAGMGVNLWSNDGGVTWENSKVSADVDTKILIYMSCEAISGTDWEFTVTMGGRQIYNKKGETGELNPNVSVIHDIINI